MKVRFEPIGETIDCAAQESVLDAAFRQGYNLAYGCREGQCSACKCFLLEGEVALEPYSTFALSDSERSGGYALMCRAVPERDLVIELLHYDPDGYRLEHSIRDGVATVEAVEALTHDMRRLVLAAPGFTFTPGQYIDVHVGETRRSFSMANADPGRIELIIKCYPGGRFSGMLDGHLRPGDEVAFTGPYGTLRVREGDRPIVMIAGGSGIAPILSLLRALQASDCPRPVRLFFAARTPFLADEVHRCKLADFRFLPVTGRRLPGLVDEYLAAGELEGSPDVYMAGPPLLLEAAEAMLGRRGVDGRRIFQDKFTIAAEAGPGRSRAAPALARRDRDSERDFSWFEASRRRASLYEDVTVDTQPSIHRHLTRGWPVSFVDGRGTWDEASTALRSRDWYAFRDPGELWERPFYQLEAALERQIEDATRSAIRDGLIGDFSVAWVEFLRRFLQVPAFVEHGLWFALATAGRDCLSDSVATAVCLQAAMKQRSAQAIALYAMDLEEAWGPFPIEAAREAFLGEEPWQPVRGYLERLWATRDWGEVIVACNLCFEPLVGTLLRRELGIRAAAANGDTVTPSLARAAAQEWEWARGWTAEFVWFLAEDASFGERNRELIAGWVDDWLPQAQRAGAALAPIVPAGVDARGARRSARGYVDELLQSVLTHPTRRSTHARQRAAVRATAGGRREPAAAADNTFDYVGIVMAKSAEGDAVAAILGGRDEVVVQEQPAFWDIRARDRLVIPYAEVSADLGYQIDAYSIQHEMSTHYGRMVATDEALILFSDPTEAMEHLMA